MTVHRDGTGVMFLAAFMFTIAAQLNWRDSYLVSDFYARFVERNGSGKHYVFVSRICTLLLVIASAWVFVTLAPLARDGRLSSTPAFTTYAASAVVNLSPKPLLTPSPSGYVQNICAYFMLLRERPPRSAEVGMIVGSDTDSESHIVHIASVGIVLGQDDLSP